MIGVTFGNVKSWDDWKVILTSVIIGIPEPKTITIDVPGADGALDLTETVYGKVPYENRTLTLVFETTARLSEKTWTDLLSVIAGDIHGKRLDIVLDEDPGWKYVGRCTLDSFATSRAKSTITITCDCYPYKYSVDDETVTSL